MSDRSGPAAYEPTPAEIEAACEAMDEVYDRNGGSADSEELAAAVLRAVTPLDSFEGLVNVARRILAKRYPADVFTGASGDLGARFVATLREVTEVLDGR